MTSELCTNSTQTLGAVCQALKDIQTLSFGGINTGNQDQPVTSITGCCQKPILGGTVAGSSLTSYIAPILISVAAGLIVVWLSRRAK